jgi:hypothetical protein
MTERRHTAIALMAFIASYRHAHRHESREAQEGMPDFHPGSLK